MQIKIGNKTATATAQHGILILTGKWLTLFGTLAVKAAGLLCDGVTKTSWTSFKRSLILFKIQLRIT